MSKRTVTIVTPAKLHKLLREACAERGGAVRVAERSGMSAHQIHNMRYGKQRINESVARALGVERVWIAK